MCKWKGNWKYAEESKKGLILEVVLDYPQELHEGHNDYQFAAEKKMFLKACYPVIVKE